MMYIYITNEYVYALKVLTEKQLNTELFKRNIISMQTITVIKRMIPEIFPRRVWIEFDSATLV